MTGTITKVFKKNEEKNWPGSVVFSDGTKLSTFSDALILAAEQGLGQLAEYTTETKGKYTNLSSLKLKGAPPAEPASAPAGQNQAKSVDFGGAVVASAVKDLTAAVRELTSALARVPRTQPAQQEQGPTVPENQVDPIEAAQVRLAEHIGSEDAAEAMFESLKKKYAKSAAKLAKAVEDLLKAHGVA